MTYAYFYLEYCLFCFLFFFFSSRRRHTRYWRDWSSDVCSSDLHLAFPQYEHRMVSMKEGDEIDLGGRSLMAVEPVIRDLRTTWWGFETCERVLFPGDGFAYSHYHEDGHCGLVAEEAASLDLQDTTAVFADLALWWTKWADMRNYCDRLDNLMETLDVKTVAPTHGLV